jgi:GT2 family glycosyltransferase
MSAVDFFVVTHNHGATIAATLAALAAQSRTPERVVIVDNGSRDPCVAIAGGFSRRLPLEVIARPDNCGFAAAANMALRRTEAPWVLALNPDCRLGPEYLAVLLLAAERFERTGAATGLLLRAEGDTLAPRAEVDSAGMVFTPAGRHLDRGAGRRPRAAWSQPAWVFGACGAAALYRRAALEDVAYPGGEVFDEGFFSYREDADLAWRLQRRGWCCLYWPAARAWHRRGLRPEAARRDTPEINRHSVRNRFLLRWSNADWRWHLACFPWWLLRDVMVLIACMTVERASWPGLAEAWALRRQQRARARANAARALVSSWRLVLWFYPGGRTRKVMH